MPESTSGAPQTPLRGPPPLGVTTLERGIGSHPYTYLLISIQLLYNQDIVTIYLLYPVNPLTGVETKCNLAIRVAGVQVRQLRMCVGVRAGWQVCK